MTPLTAFARVRARADLPAPVGPEITMAEGADAGEEVGGAEGEDVADEEVGGSGDGDGRGGGGMGLRVTFERQGNETQIAAATNQQQGEFGTFIDGLLDVIDDILRRGNGFLASFDDNITRL